MAKKKIEVIIKVRQVWGHHSTRRCPHEGKGGEAADGKGEARGAKGIKAQPAAEAAEESAKKPKTAKEAKKPEVQNALKHCLVSDEVAEKPKKKLKSEKDQIGGKLNLFSTIQVPLLTTDSPASFECHPRLNWCGVWSLL